MATNYNRWENVNEMHQIDITNMNFVYVSTLNTMPQCIAFFVKVLACFRNWFYRQKATPMRLIKVEH